MCTHIYFFQWFVTHRDLHSFPTRRSSDLITLMGSTLYAGLPFDPPAGAQKIPAGDRHPVRARGGIERRSEEHTSELQSRGQLVCRLLFEKKKTYLIRSDVVHYRQECVDGQ